MLKRIYGVFCKIELWTTALLLVTIAILVFLSAMMRSFGKPINWSDDISLLLFAWLVFIGGDVIIREGNLISVDMLQNLLPPPMRKALHIIFYLMILAFLYALVRYGVPLLLTNRRRMFMSTNLSYSWCTLSVPAGSILMGISIVIRLVKTIMSPAPGTRGPAQ